MTDVIYKITVESFKWKDEVYNVAMSPVFYAEDEGIDFTGSYTGFIIDPNIGTMHFTLSPDGKQGWEIDSPRHIDPNVIDQIVKIISKIEDGTSRQF